MNLDKAIETMRIISTIPVKDPLNQPEIRIYYNQGEGYTLRIKTSVVNAEFRNCLTKMVKLYKLGVRQSKGYLIIYCDS